MVSEKKSNVIIPLFFKDFFIFDFLQLKKKKYAKL